MSSETKLKLRAQECFSDLIAQDFVAREEIANISAP